MKVGIIIVNYNRADLLDRCLGSVMNQKYKNINIYVVDNGSGDGSIDLIKKRFGKVKLIEMGYNSGFCKANNIGIEAAFKDDCGGVILLNNDATIIDDFVFKVIKEIDIEKRIGMISTKIILDGTSVLDSIGLAITPDGLAKNDGFSQDSSIFNEKKEVFCPAGAAAFYSRELLEDIRFNNKFFDEMYEFYFEELDLGWRARLIGWKCKFVPEAIAYHHKSATAGPYSEFIAFYTNRNIFYNIFKNYPGYFVLKALMLSFFRYLLLFLGIIIRKGAGSKINKNIGKVKLLRVSLMGIRDVIKNMPLLIRKRRYIMNKKSVNNREIKEWFKKFGIKFLDSVYR